MPRQRSERGSQVPRFLEKGVSFENLRGLAGTPSNSGAARPRPEPFDVVVVGAG